MENTNVGMTVTAPSSIASPASSSNLTDLSFYWTLLKYTGIVFLILVILAVIGLNVFSYLATGTQDVATGVTYLANIIKQKMAKGTIQKGVKSVIGVSALGTQKIVDTALDDVRYGIDTVEKGIDKGLNKIIEKTGGTPVQSTIPPSSDDSQDSALNQTLNQSSSSGTGKGGDYEPNDSTSSTAKAGKSGWCYIGMEQGTRVCASVGANDTCMSGDIFPSNEICVNPNMRM